MTSTTDFPTTGVELRYLLVVSDYARSLAFYRDVLGARVVRQISDVLCLLSFGGSEFLLTVGGSPTQDKPTVIFAPPPDPPVHDAATTTITQLERNPRVRSSMDGTRRRSIRLALGRKRRRT